MAKLTRPETILKLEEFLPSRLDVLLRVVSQTLSQVYERYDLTSSEWQVLATLNATVAIRAEDVGVQCNMHRAKVSRAVNSLLKRDIITRRKNPQDLREAFLRLTPYGHEIVGECLPLIVKIAGQMEEAISPEDREAFERCLGSLVSVAKRLKGMGSP